MPRPLIAFLAFFLLAASALCAQTHRYRVTQQFEIARSDLRLWVPLPLSGSYQRVFDLNVSGSFTRQERHTDGQNGAEMLFLAFGKEPPHRATVVFSVEVTDRQSDFSLLSEAGREENLSVYLQGTEHLPVDGVVAAYAAKITEGAASDLEKARRVYAWVVANMFRDPAVRGCGLGDARKSLESGYLGGKCADVSAVFVALLRAAGVPAREVFGIRAAPSRYSEAYGVKGSDITTAQHCRAEFYIRGLGWVPADPADITKLILVEELDRNDAKVKAEIERQFGSWEMNWFAYNSARDFVLTPRPIQYPLSIFSYPYAEAGDEPLDYYDPKNFAYTITVSPLP